MERLRIGFACCARLSFDCEYAARLFERSRAALAAQDIDVVHAEGLTITEQDAQALSERFAAERVDLILIQYATFCLGTLIPILTQRPQVPILLWGVPEPSLVDWRLRSNSLCGVNMNAHTLMRLGRPYSYIFSIPEDAAPALTPHFRALACMKRLGATRLGLVGYRVPGFYTSTCDELELRKKVGVEIHHVSLAEVYEIARGIDPAGREREAAAIRAEACSVEVAGDDLDKAAALYLGLRHAAEKHRLDALAVKCWPEFPDSYGIAACSTLGRLNDAGIMTSCEGDIHGAVTMLIARHLSGKPVLFADFIAFDENRNTGVAWHCGAAPSCLADNAGQVRLCKHPVVDGGGKKGVTVAFPIVDEGPVTMARFGAGADGLRLFFAGGSAVQTSTRLAGNTLEVQFDSPVHALMDTIIGEGIEHHYAFVHADIRAELRVLAKWLRLGVIDADARQA